MSRRPLPDGHRINDYQHLLQPRRGEAARRAVRTCPRKRKHRGRQKQTVAAADDLHRRLQQARPARGAHRAAPSTVEGADKLLKLTLDVGDGTRTVFAGIKSAYAPEKLEGRLDRAGGEPRAAQDEVRRLRRHGAGRFGRSGPGIFLISPDSGAQPGMRVK